MQERYNFVKSLFENSKCEFIDYKEEDYLDADVISINVYYKKGDEYKGFLLYETKEFLFKLNYFKSIMKMKLKKDL